MVVEGENQRKVVRPNGGAGKGETRRKRSEVYDTLYIGAWCEAARC